MGRFAHPRAAEVHLGTRPLAAATSTMITNLDHLLSVVTMTVIQPEDAA